AEEHGAPSQRTSRVPGSKSVTVPLSRSFVRLRGSAARLSGCADRGAEASPPRPPESQYAAGQKAQRGGGRFRDDGEHLVLDAGGGEVGAVHAQRSAADVLRLQEEAA